MKYYFKRQNDLKKEGYNMTERQLERAMQELNVSLYTYQKAKRLSESMRKLPGMVERTSERLNAQLDMLHMLGLRVNYDREKNRYIVKNAKRYAVVCSDRFGSVHHTAGTFETEERALRECEEWGWKYCDEEGKSFYMEVIELD